MKRRKYSSLTLNVQLGDIEFYTAPDMGFVGSFAVTPKIHSHPYYEIIAVIDGNLRIGLLDGEDIKLGYGNLCVIPPKCYHSTCSDGKTPKMLAIRFSYDKVSGDEKIYDSFCSALERILEPTCFEMPEGIPQTLIDLRREMTGKGAAWELMCRSLLQRLYIDIFRLLSSDNAPETSNYISDDSRHSRYYRIEMWFADNFANQVTEDDLASEVSISKRHLSRVFADIYGMNFREKIIEVRLHRAAQLLEQTGMNIDKIAIAVGYKSFSGFHRAFVKNFNCTPFEYRKQNGAKSDVK